MTDMDITIHSSFLPHIDPDASLAFYRDALGFEVRNDVGYGGMRWLTVGPADQPGTSIVLHPPAADPGITDDERRTITEMMAKGTYASINLATKDLDGTFEQLQAGDAGEHRQPPLRQRDADVLEVVLPRTLHADEVVAVGGVPVHAQRSSWIRTMLPAGSRTAQSRTP